MNQFVQVGQRIINLALVCSAERARHHVTLQFAVTNAEGDPLSLTFDDPAQIEQIWQHLVALTGADDSGGAQSNSSARPRRRIRVVTPSATSASPPTAPPPPDREG